MGPAAAVLDAPEHPYSWLIKASVLSTEDAGDGRLEPAVDLADTSDALATEPHSQLEARPDGRQVRVYTTS